MRMYLNFRRQMLRKNFEPLAADSSPITLFDFNRHDDAIDCANAESARGKGWRVSDDEVIGGYSRGKVDLIRTSADYRRWMTGEKLQDQFTRIEDTDDTINGDDESSELDTKHFTPFLRWSGKVDTTVGLTSDAQRSGFCAIRSPEFPFGGVDLQGLYNALEIICRTDGRTYTVNLGVSTFFPGDMYQGYIRIRPTYTNSSFICPETGGEYERLVLPFRSFVLTAFGRLRDVQRELDSSVEIEHIGFTLMDGRDGDFQFDLARIRAVNFDGRDVLNEARIEG